jgi:hypothetical protein
MLQDTIHDLAQLPVGKPDILSIYLDARPVGGQPQERADLVRLHSRLHAIDQTLWPRGPACEEFDHDVAEVSRYLDQDMPHDAEGLALFASHGRQLFVAVPAGAPFSFEVAFAPAPHLYQVTRLIDLLVPAVVVLIDRQTARLFVTRLGQIHEREDLKTDAASMRQIHFFAGAGIKHYERHIAEHRKAFAQEIGAAIERLAQQEQAQHIFVLGNREAIPWVRDALSEPVAKLVLPVVLPMDIAQTPSAIQQAVLPILELVQEDEAHAAADLVIDAVRAHGLGIVGVEETRAALERGSVETLVLSESATDLETRDALTQQALATDATIEVIGQHDVLDHLGGVGALLRYRLLA